LVASKELIVAETLDELNRALLDNLLVESTTRVTVIDQNGLKHWVDSDCYQIVVVDIGDIKRLAQ